MKGACSQFGPTSSDLPAQPPHTGYCRTGKHLVSRSIHLHRFPQSITQEHMCYIRQVASPFFRIAKDFGDDLPPTPDRGSLQYKHSGSRGSRTMGLVAAAAVAGATRMRCRGTGERGWVMSPHANGVLMLLWTESAIHQHTHNP